MPWRSQLGHSPFAFFVPAHVAVLVRTEHGYDVVATSRALRVNGRRVGAARLVDGDLLECGKSRLRYSQA